MQDDQIRPARRRKGEDKIALGLALGQTTAEVAKAANVSEATVYRRQRDPAVRQRISELRGSLLDRSLGLLVAGSTAGVVTLNWLAINATSEGVRCRAADRLLEHVLKLRDHQDVDSRLREVERTLAEEGDGET
jgi:AcrR family transcriptional regulator